ncbi:MAG TPA: glycosyltransferase [Ferruginibacter sp.]|nr:glycosyltransferase [Ferruginibacter sp.]HMP19638.1 glycosyltransferase [Ferruginibacter sp.]
MHKKKILIVSRSFYPENTPRSFRTTELAKEFCRQGHEVTVYTIKDEKEHPPLEKEFGMVIKSIGQLKFKPIDINAKNKLLYLFKRGLSRLLLMFAEYPNIELMFMVKRALKNENGYDLLISIAVPHPVHWGVAWARTKKNPIAKTWVADCGDGYMLELAHDTFKKLFYFKYLEKWFCRKADYISIPNISLKGNYYPEFWNKIVDIPQGFVFEEVQVKNPVVNNPVPTFAFAGIFMRTTRNPSQLLDFLISTNRDFRFIVYTRTADLLLPYMAVLKDKLEIRNFIKREVLIKELSTFDFLINIGYDPSNHIPSKLIDYYLSGRPVLSQETNEVNKKVVEEFLDGNYSNGFKFVDMDRFRIENVCRKFLALP